MKNKFNEIRDTPEEVDKLHSSTIDENSASLGFSKPNVGRMFMESISEEELSELDANTATSPETSAQEVDPEYTEEELQGLWDNDPGYLNDRVIHTYATEIASESGNKVIAPAFNELHDENGELKEEYIEYGDFYRQTGLHRVSWGEGDGGVEGTEKKTELSKGMIVDRWAAPGVKGGTYLAESGTDFYDLHLNVSEDKREKVQYEVLKPFTVIESIIADQPFDEDIQRKPAKQFRTAMDISDLVEMGYLKKVDAT